jgi:CRISPR-associated endonuclease/helicase Cas3
VREAQEAWNALAQAVRGRGEQAPPIRIIIVHARYTRRDRDGIESSLVEILGKNAGDTRPERMIVVATQVIEQSIDIDFDAMISDLAPVDLLLQRAGRLWRHERSPEERRGHTAPILHVLMPTTEERRALEYGTSAYVYDEETLARSATTILEGNVLWKMPEACRLLVAEVYDRDDSSWTVDRLDVDPERLEKARARREKTERDLKLRAKKIILPAAVVDDMTDLEMEDAFSDDERDADLVFSTRYGSASATVVLLRRIDGALRFVGSPTLPIETLPSPDQIRTIIGIEEAVLLSSVSFPWYEAIDPTHSDEDLKALDEWWRARHPYDRKVFILLQADGTFGHPQLEGCYRTAPSGEPLEGLVIQKSGKNANNTPVPLEAI